MIYKYRYSKCYYVSITLTNVTAAATRMFVTDLVISYWDRLFVVCSRFTSHWSVCLVTICNPAWYLYCRHLGSQLSELEKLIRQMAHQEFLTFITRYLNPPPRKQESAEIDEVAHGPIVLIRLCTFSNITPSKNGLVELLPAACTY